MLKLKYGIDPEEFKRVHAPIGLGIDAATPQEIAVSIAAELVQARRGKNNKFLDILLFTN